MFYDTNYGKFTGYKRDDLCIPNFKNMSIKKVGGPGFGGFYTKPNDSLRNYNPGDSMMSGGVDYECMTARDEKMYNQTEFYKNI